METMNIAVGFVTGRSNVCNIINSYAEFLKDQMKEFYNFYNFTFYILYDLSYQNTKREEFYNIKKELSFDSNIKIKYITPENIEDLKGIIEQKYHLKQEMCEKIIGHGHAKGRNTIMYSAYCDKMDYLLFWDDDEYPIACLKDENGKITWKMQNNVTKHIETMLETEADVSIGYHCGYISPIPYINFGKEEDEFVINNFITGISNDIVNWENIKEKYKKDNGVTFADPNVLNSEPYEVQQENGAKFIAGSTLCINLKQIDKIPAFYNPHNARGEDTFFSTRLENSKVMKVPVYHFHDGFLKYKQIMKNNLPDKLRLIYPSEDAVEERFYKACLGWIKYKPLYIYISKREKYREIIDDVYIKLEKSIPKMNELMPNHDFNDILKALEIYDKNVENDYKEFLEVNNIWDELKMKFYEK